MGSVFCSSCGNPIPAGSAFCGKCGAPVNRAGGNGTTIIYTREKVPGRGFGISGMILGIIGLVYAVAFLGMVNEFSELFDIIDLDIPLVAYFVYAVMPALGVIFGYCAHKRGYRCGISTSGIVLGIIGLICILLAIFAAAV